VGGDAVCLAFHLIKLKGQKLVFLSIEGLNGVLWPSPHWKFNRYIHMLRNRRRVRIIASLS